MTDFPPELPDRLDDFSRRLAALEPPRPIAAVLCVYAVSSCSTPVSGEA
jgi:hypothetical protein